MLVLPLSAVSADTSLLAGPSPPLLYALITMLKLLYGDKLVTVYLPVSPPDTSTTIASLGIARLRRFALRRRL